MGDLQIGEAFQDRCFITVLATGLPATLLADVSTVFIDELGNRAAGVVTEQSNGWYTSPFTPDAAGTWAVEWSKGANPENYVFHYPYKEFKVGGGEVTDIKAETALILADTNAILTDTSTTLDDLVDDLETRLTAARAGYLDNINQAGLLQVTAARGGYLDELAAANLPADIDVIKADTPYIADAALPAAPTASSLASRLRAISVLETTIGPNNRSTTSCELVAGDPHNSAYVNMIVVLDNNEANLNYVSRTVTAYTGASKTITWTPALTHDAVDGGKIWLCSNDTKINVTADAIKARTDRLEITKCFFSPQQALVTLDTSHTDAALPTVTLPNITGTITHAYAGIKFRMIENSNAAVNKLSGAQEIQIQAAAEGWLDCIHFVDDQFSLAATTKEGGDCILGYTDVVATVDVFNDTYEFQWDEPLTDQNSIKLHDVQTFIVVSYY